MKAEKIKAEIEEIINAASELDREDYLALLIDIKALCNLNEFLIANKLKAEESFKKCSQHARDEDRKEFIRAYSLFKLHFLARKTIKRRAFQDLIIEAIDECEESMNHHDEMLLDFDSILSSSKASISEKISAEEQAQDFINEINEKIQQEDNAEKASAMLALLIQKAQSMQSNIRIFGIQK